MIYNIKRQEDDERDKLFCNYEVSPITHDLQEQLRKNRPIVVPYRADLRSQCPPVFNQGELGSCSANAGCTNIVMVLKKPEVVLSRLYMYYQERAKEGTITEDSGAQMRDICKVAVKGVCEENFFPYVIQDFAKAPTAAANADSVNHKVTAYHSVRTLAEIKQAIGVNGQAVLMGMDVFESFEDEPIALTGKMSMPKANEQNLGGHAVLIVGYDDLRKVLIVRNSWGDKWGDKGYFYMPYDYVLAGFAFDFWVLS